MLPNSEVYVTFLWEKVDATLPWNEVDAMFSLEESLCHVVVGTVRMLRLILCILDFVCCLERWFI